ncbi:MAG: 4,5-DOPA dioxygenase extradiol [Flavobacteriales bacterium]|nr:4,5-DOPA dioxygenase extradiol [Flavobacteriales bacterium]
MERRTFVKKAGINTLGLGLISSTTKSSLDYLEKLSEAFDYQDSILPSFFIGHGNPMNGIEDNVFSNEWKRLGQSVQKPKLILCISAHWLTKGTYITAMDKPKTIHDFGNFPSELSEVQYPVPGAPQQAQAIIDMIESPTIHADHEWGLDHGSWTVIRQMFPKADIPVLQLSISYHESGAYHYELGQKLKELRKRGVLIIGSGNVVHNLRKVGFPKDISAEEGMTREYGYDWAIEANELVKEKILSGDHKPLLDYTKLGEAVNLAVPTPDHYYPLLYALGTQDGEEEISIFNDNYVAGSLSMTSIQIG